MNAIRRLSRDFGFMFVLVGGGTMIHMVLFGSGYLPKNETRRSIAWNVAL